MGKRAFLRCSCCVLLHGRENFKPFKTQCTANKSNNFTSFLCRFFVDGTHRIFQVLDYPLFPPTITDFAFFTPISTNVDTSDCFRFFRECKLSSDDIADMFNSTLTVFCPTREAFTFFNYEDFNRLLSPDWYRHACEFLMNHIMLGAMTREELEIGRAHV